MMIVYLRVITRNFTIKDTSSNLILPYSSIQQYSEYSSIRSKWGCLMMPLLSNKGNLIPTRYPVH